MQHIPKTLHSRRPIAGTFRSLANSSSPARTPVAINRREQECAVVVRSVLLHSLLARHESANQAGGTTMRVEDVMTRGIQTVSPETSADDAWNLMRTLRVHHLVVTDGPRIAGILSDRDAGGPKGTSVRKNRTVQDLMTSAVVTVPPATTIRKAANVMRGRSIGCLVVADGRRTLGIVTVADLLDLLGRGMERTVTSTKRPLLQHRVPHRKQRRVRAAW